MKPIVIIGQTASGKTSLASALENRGYSRILEYTTRKPRDALETKLDYHFVTDDEFASMVKSGEFAASVDFHARFGHVWYGIADTDMDAATRKKSVLITNPRTLSKLNEAGYDMFVVLLDYRQETLVRRALNRGDDVSEVRRRIETDAQLFREIKENNLCDLCISDPKITTDQIAEIIESSVANEQEIQSCENCQFHTLFHDALCDEEERREGWCELWAACSPTLQAVKPNRQSAGEKESEESDMNKLDLHSPWQIHRQKLAAAFELDAKVTVGPVEETENGPTVTVSVDDTAKANALRKVLPDKKFGDVTLHIVVVDTAGEETPADILRTAFAYNRRFRGVEAVKDPTGTEWNYLLAEPEVVQFPADNLADYRGNMTMTIEEAARDVLDLSAGTAVCTADLREN